MTLLNIKNLDFSQSQSSFIDVEFPFDLDIDGAKSVSYVVRWQLAKRRSGSAKTKSMSELSGTTAKPHKQKGTGRARQGSKRSVQFVGGRTCHGPTPRDFNFSIPKKIVKKALSSAIKSKLIQKKILILSNFGSEINTSKFNSALVSNNIQKALVVCNVENLAITKSVSNIKNVKVITPNAINVYDILNFDYLIVGIEILEKNILGSV